MTKKSCEIKKTILNHKHDKYIATHEYHKLTVDNFVLRLKQKNWQAKAILLI